LLTMPGWIGSGVEIPFGPTVAVGVLLLVVVVLMTPTQAYVFAWRPLHCIPPTPEFQRTKFSVEIGPLKKATRSQVSPGLTLTNLLQLLTMPRWIGRGVVMPFGPTVWVGSVVVVVVVMGDGVVDVDVVVVEVEVAAVVWPVLLLDELVVELEVVGLAVDTTGGSPDAPTPVRNPAC
jgi:hypothetical protein